MNIDLLKALCETPGAPGHEHRVRDLITKEVKGLFDEVKTDAMGSLMCKRNPTKKGKGTPLKVMLCCHMDEIGFLVSHISKDGFINIQPVGGFDPRVLHARRVLVCTDKGDYKAVMNPGGKGLHISTPEERKKQHTVGEFIIDTGMGEDAAKKIQVGDFVVMDEPLIEIGTKAKKKKIPYQRTLLAAGGQDGAAAQQAAAGARAVGVVVGTRYIHTVTEMIEKSDLEAAKDILVAYLAQA